MNSLPIDNTEKQEIKTNGSLMRLQNIQNPRIPFLKEIKKKIIQYVSPQIIPWLEQEYQPEIIHCMKAVDPNEIMQANGSLQTIFTVGITKTMALPLPPSDFKDKTILKEHIEIQLRVNWAYNQSLITIDQFEKIKAIKILSWVKLKENGISEQIIVVLQAIPPENVNNEHAIIALHMFYLRQAARENDVGLLSAILHSIQANMWIGNHLGECDASIKKNPELIMAALALLMEQSTRKTMLHLALENKSYHIVRKLMPYLEMIVSYVNVKGLLQLTHLEEEALDRGKSIELLYYKKSLHEVYMAIFMYLKFYTGEFVPKVDESNFFKAVCDGNFQLVQNCFDVHPEHANSFLATCDNVKEDTLLMLSIKNNHLKLAEFLLDKGAPTHPRNKEGKSALDLFELVYNDEEEKTDDLELKSRIKQKLQGKPVDIKILTSAISDIGNPAKKHLIKENEDKIKDFILSFSSKKTRGLIINQFFPLPIEKKEVIYTPFQYAIMRKCSLEILNFLKENGGDLNQRNSDSSTLFMTAARVGNIVAMKFLAECKVSVTKKNKAGKTALDLARDDQENAKGKTEEATKKIKAEYQKVIDLILTLEAAQNQKMDEKMSVSAPAATETSVEPMNPVLAITTASGLSTSTSSSTSTGALLANSLTGAIQTKGVEESPGLNADKNPAMEPGGKDTPIIPSPTQRH